MDQEKEIMEFQEVELTLARRFLPVLRDNYFNKPILRQNSNILFIFDNWRGLQMGQWISTLLV